MITYTFILKDTNSQTSPVFLAIRGSGRRLKISTGLTVQTDAWDKDNFQMTRKSPFHKTENAILLKWKNAAETAVREAEPDNVSLEKTKYDVGDHITVASCRIVPVLMHGHSNHALGRRIQFVFFPD